MEIGLYIAELLSEQDEVSVTGLGTFTKERIAGKLDSQSNLFYPPYYHLSFKETFFSSSLLSEYISLKKDLSTSSSEELIKKFTETIQDILNNSDVVEINHLGKLYKENNHLEFKQSEGFEINGKFYGLKPIPELQIESIPSPNEELLTDFPNFPSQVEENEVEEEIDVDSPKSKLLPVLAISILAVSATLFGFFYFDQNFNLFVRNIISPKTSTSAPVEPIITSITAASDSVNIEAGITDSNTIINEKTLESSQKEIKSKPDADLTDEKVNASNEDIIYEIIVAAFARKKDAESYIVEMNSKGYKAKIVENLPGKIMKISLGTFADEVSANNELKQIQNDINKDAWIARVKPLKNP
jgi:nucleoid DNA-binding protein/cell division septation protein DedD